MAYIDRNLLIEKIESKKISDIIPNWQNPEILDAIYKQGQAIKEIIKKQSTADVVEVPSDMIIFAQGKWLILNMESEQLGEAIKSCVDYLTKNAKRKEVD